jgi:hypothetical protein
MFEARRKVGVGRKRRLKMMMPVPGWSIRT